MPRRFHYEGSALLYAGCACGEYLTDALRRRLRNGRPQCMNCADTRHARGLCAVCLQDDVPIENHHIAGRKHGDTVIPICLNCHALLSQSQRVWVSPPPLQPMYLICGVQDVLRLMLMRGQPKVGCIDSTRLARRCNPLAFCMG